MTGHDIPDATAHYFANLASVNFFRALTFTRANPVATIVGLSFLVIVLTNAGKIRRAFSPIFDAGKRRKITKAADTLGKSVQAYKNELSEYRDAIQGITTADLSDRAKLVEAYDDLRHHVGALALPKLSTKALIEALPHVRIHANTDVYYAALALANGIESFTTAYKLYFSSVNEDYIVDIDELIKNQYHETQIKAGSEYIMQKNTIRNAEQAVKYFNKYTLFINAAIGSCENCLNSINTIKKKNVFYGVFVEVKLPWA